MVVVVIATTDKLVWCRLSRSTRHVRECMKHGGCCSRLIHQRHVQRFVEELPQNRNTAQSAEERRSCNRFHYQTRAAPYDYTTSAARTETCSRAIRQSLIRRGRMARTPSLPYAEDSKKSDKQERVKRRMCCFCHLPQLSVYPEAGRNSKVWCPVHSH